MCGIVGVIPKQKSGFDHKQEAIFYELLYAGALRGDDSTGIISVEKDGSFGTLKDASTSAWAIPAFQKESLAIRAYNEGCALIGHNRKSTIGLTNDQNAHPFVVDDFFATVHNGTLFGHKTLANTEVDSEALAIHLSKTFNDDISEEKLTECFSEVNGAYATVSYNQKTHCVYLIRNSQRPLFLATNDRGWYWASEGNMLSWILSRNGEDMLKTKIELIKENVLYTINLEKGEVSTMECPPKKTSTHHGKHGGTGYMTKGVIPFHKKVQEVFSKNSFKRERSKLIATTIVFYVDEYVEKNFPKTTADGETALMLMGESDSISALHVVQGDFDLKVSNVHESAIRNKLFTGFVDDCFYDRKSSIMTIKVSKITKVKESLQHETTTKMYTVH